MKRYFGIIDTKEGIVAEVTNAVVKLTAFVVGVVATIIGFQGTRSFIKDEGFVKAISTFYNTNQKISDIVLVAASVSIAFSVIAQIIKMIYFVIEYANSSEVFEDIK